MNDYNIKELNKSTKILLRACILGRSYGWMTYGKQV
jgi:hypothetical protein